MANITFTRDEELTDDELMAVMEVFQSIEDDALGDEPTLDVMVLDDGTIKYELTLTRHLDEEESRQVYDLWMKSLPEIDVSLEFSMDIADPAELDDFDEVNLCEDCN